VRRLHERRGRAAEGRFALEGEDLLREALDAGVLPELALLDATFDDEELRAALRSAGVETADVAADALASAATLAHPPRCIAVVARVALPSLTEGAPARALGLQLHGVHDPGNVGTLVRACAALGPAHLALGHGTADPLSPKAVRASMGALFRVPLVALNEAPPARVVALDGRAETPLHAADLSGPLAFALGGERHGVPDDVLAAADAVASIPQEPAAESLNVAMAGTLALYEVRRRSTR
jgi:TrmH family RNA methyltransferase